MLIFLLTNITCPNILDAQYMHDSVFVLKNTK
jgi:hypothetical protein